MPTRVLILLAKRSYRADDFLDAATRLGVDVTVGTDHRPTLARFAPEAALHLDFADLDHSVSRIVELANRHPLRGIIAAEDDGVLLAAEAARALGLPHNPPEAAAAARRKDRTRQTLAGAGLPSPRYIVQPSSTDPTAAAEAARSAVDYPLVLKPVSLSASRGVIRADDDAEYVDAWRRIVSILADPQLRRSDPEGSALVLSEAYLPGDELALEGLLEKGALRLLALLDKPDPLTGPFFEETLYVTPSRLSARAQRSAIDATARACAALGLRDGPIHAELRWDGETAWLVEVAPRSIGGLCSRVLRFGVGVSLEELILRHACGIEPLVPLARSSAAVSGALRGESDPGLPTQNALGAAGVLMLPVTSGGVLLRVDGRDSALGVPGIEGVTILARPGDRLLPPPEGHRYPGFIFGRGTDPAAVEAALREAGARIRLVLEG